MTEDPTNAERQARFRARQKAKLDLLRNGGLEARIRELEAELARERAEKKGRPLPERLVRKKRKKLERMAPAPAQAEEESIDTLRAELEQAQRTIKSNNTRIKNFNQRLRALASKKSIAMSKALVREMRAALHPDRAVDDPRRRKRLEELSQEFNSYTFVTPDD